MFEDDMFEDDARRRDAEDPGHRSLFLIPPAQGGRYQECAYFAGNSLGLQPRTIRDELLGDLDNWARLGVEGHMDGSRPWVRYNESLTEPAARLVGALPAETVVMNSLTVNLHLMMATFYRPEGDRTKLLIDEPAFPSDRYAAESQVRHHGLDPAADIAAPSTNYRLADILCAVGIPQLRRLDELLAARTRIAAAYTERLQGAVEVPSADEGDTHGWQAYVVRLDRRDEALATLRAEGIEVQIGTYALHRLSAYADQGPFPGAEAAFQLALALPLHSRLEETDLDRVAEGIARFA